MAKRQQGAQVSSDPESGQLASRKVAVDTIRRQVTTLLVEEGLSERDATWTTDWLVDSDLSGVASHGLRQLPRYVERMRHGGINPSPEIRVVRGRDAAFVIDGDNGLGQVVATWAVQESISRARRAGSATATVFNSNHLGALAYMARLATDERMVLFACQNTRPNTAPWGGRHATLGNNPLVWALPRADGHALVLDMATSKTAGGTLKHARLNGLPIPHGLALDEHGEPTTDPTAALQGAMLPFGEHKGSGIGMVAGALAGVLSGANVGWSIPHQLDYSRPRSIGHYISLVDIEAILPWDDYLERIEHYLEEIVAVPSEHAPNVRLPGERAESHRRKALLDGIDVELPVLQLIETGEINNVLDDAAVG